MVKIIKRPDIENILSNIGIDELCLNQEQAFLAYSNGKVIVPPVGHLAFEDPPGDCHIKYGYLQDSNCFVVKVATGFYNNSNLDLPAGDGFMALFNSRTGMLECLLVDEGYLTNIRTAVAGMIAAKYLAPKDVHGIGVIGTGCQARLQAVYLKNLVNCRTLWVFGRSQAKLQLYKTDMQMQGFEVRVARSADELAQNCNLIVTTTASSSAVISAKSIQSGTHITAVGADNPGKQEIDPQIIEHSDIVVADSYIQCSKYGELSHALKQNLISPSKIIELGAVITSPDYRRTSTNQITIADLTGIAAQDINISRLVHSPPCNTGKLYLNK